MSSQCANSSAMIWPTRDRWPSGSRPSGRRRRRPSRRSRPARCARTRRSRATGRAASSRWRNRDPIVGDVDVAGAAACAAAADAEDLVHAAALPDCPSGIRRTSRRSGVFRRLAWWPRRSARQFSASTMVTLAMPPPSHIVCRPKRFPWRWRAWTRGRHQLGAGSAERVTERDRSAVHVEPRRVGPELLQPGERDRREGLVHLVEIEVRDAPAGACSSATRVARIGSSSMMTGSPAVTVR